MQRPIGLEATLGYATPTGGVGLRADVTLLRWLSANAGVGLGLGGLQTAALLRLRYPFVASAFGLETGWSGGRFTRAPPLPGACEGASLSADCRTWDFANWVNVAATYEYRSTGGFTFRGYLGLAHSWTEDCVNDSTHPAGNGGICYSPPLLPYAGVAIGYAFEI